MCKECKLFSLKLTFLRTLFSFKVNISMPSVFFNNNFFLNYARLTVRKKSQKLQTNQQR